VFTGLWLGGPKVRDHWEDLGVNERITLSWTLWRWLMGRTGFSWLMIGSSGRLFSHKQRLFLISWVTISFSNTILHHGVSE
jgi:hypothetical protein